jgi:hypothetical protein
MNTIYPIPIPSSQASGMAYFYATQEAGGSYYLGQLLKPLLAKIFVILDYSQLSSGATISSYNFTVDIASVPPLAITGSGLDVTNKILSFYVAGGIASVYKLSVNATMSNAEVRTDWIEVTIPDADCGCAPGSGSSIPIFPNQVQPAGNYFVSEQIQYFVAASPPTGANVMDQWYNTATGHLYENVTDGNTTWWMDITGTALFAEILNVTGVNAVSNLTKTPIGAVELVINNVSVFTNAGANPPFSVDTSGAVTWNTANTPYSIGIHDKVQAIYNT